MDNGLPDAGVLATILLIAGLFLLALELMIPSFGMIGILAALSLLISAWCAWQAWWEDSPGFFWTYAAFWILGIPGVLGGMLFVLQNTSLGDRIVLRAPDEEIAASEDTNPLGSLVGQLGEAASLLTPGGMVTVNGERYHAESPGMMIESGSAVKVIGIKSSRLVVRAHEPSDDGPAAEPTETDPSEAVDDQRHAADTVIAGTSHPEEDTGILDFEIPES